MNTILFLYEKISRKWVNPRTFFYYCTSLDVKYITYIFLHFILNIDVPYELIIKLVYSIIYFKEKRLLVTYLNNTVDALKCLTLNFFIFRKILFFKNLIYIYISCIGSAQYIFLRGGGV